jgi:signal transduction histidine kinase
VATKRAAFFHPESPLPFILYFLAYLSVLIRVLLRTPEEGAVHEIVYGLLAVFLALSILLPAISRRWAWWIHVHLVLASALICTLLLTEPRLDYYALLFISLSIVAVQYLPRGADVKWLAAICVMLTAGLIAAFGPRAAAPFATVYIAGSLIIGLYGRASRTAEAARKKSEELLERLEEANRRLRAYAEQAEEAAAAQERARLARELHDAATQTVFSMNLTAQAAKMAIGQDPARVPGMLDRLQELARDALSEMRLLIDELRPQSVAEAGLVRALERHAALRERRDGLRVRLTVEGDEPGDPAVKDALFRSAREALSNVFKHAGVGEAEVTLAFSPREAALRVRDSGRGFDPEADRQPESYGLQSIRERVEALGGTVCVRSAPAEGTEVEIRLPLDPGGA